MVKNTNPAGKSLHHRKMDRAPVLPGVLHHDIHKDRHQQLQHAVARLDRLAIHRTPKGGAAMDQLIPKNVQPIEDDLEEFGNAPIVQVMHGRLIGTCKRRLPYGRKPPLMIPEVFEEVFVLYEHAQRTRKLLPEDGIDAVMFVVRNEFSDEDPEAFPLGRGRNTVGIGGIKGVESDPVRYKYQIRMFRLLRSADQPTDGPIQPDIGGLWC